MSSETLSNERFRNDTETQPVEAVAVPEQINTSELVPVLQDMAESSTATSTLEYIADSASSSGENIELEDISALPEVNDTLDLPEDSIKVEEVNAIENPQSQLEAIAQGTEGQKMDKAQFGKTAIEMKKVFDTLPAEVQSKYEAQIGKAWLNRNKEPEALNKLLDEMNAETPTNQVEDAVVDEKSTEAENTVIEDDTTSSEVSEANINISDIPEALDEQPDIPDRITSERKSESKKTTSDSNLMSRALYELDNSGDREPMIEGFKDEVKKMFPNADNLPRDEAEQAAVMFAAVYRAIRNERHAVRLSRNDREYDSSVRALYMLKSAAEGFSNMSEEKQREIFSKIGFKERDPKLMIPEVIGLLSRKRKYNAQYLGIS